MTCHDEGFSVGVLDSLGAIAVQQHKLDIAKWAAHRALRIRQQRGWSVSVTLGQLIEAPWYKGESIQPISQEALHQIVKDAELFIQADLPQYNANYIDSFTTKRGKQIVKFGAVINGEPQELTMPMRSVQADLKFIAGEPVKLTVNDSTDQLNIMAVNQRQSGFSFDSMRQISGRFRLHPKGFGFVDDAYVPHEIASP